MNALSFSPALPSHFLSSSVPDAFVVKHTSGTFPSELLGVTILKRPMLCSKRVKEASRLGWSNIHVVLEAFFGSPWPCLMPSQSQVRDALGFGKEASRP